MKNTLPPQTQQAAVAALRRRGLSTTFILTALGKWQAGAQPDPCREEVMGKEIGLHTGCECDGCQQRVTMMFLSSVQALATRDHLP